MADDLLNLDLPIEDDDLNIGTLGMFANLDDLNVEGLEGLPISLDDNGDFLSLDEGEEDFILSLDEEEDEINASALLGEESIEDTVEVLHSCMQRIKTIMDATDVIDNSVDFTIPRYAVPFMSNAEYEVFNAVVRDLAIVEEFASWTEFDKITYSFNVMYESALYTPGIDIEEYTRVFKSYLTKFHYLHIASKSAAPSMPLLKVVSQKKLKDLYEFFETNSFAFKYVSTILMNRPEDDVDIQGTLQGAGVVLQTYAKKNHIRVMTSHRMYDCIYECLMSEDTAHMLGLSQEQLLGLSSGEIIRRLFVCEFQSQVFYPVGITQKPAFDPNSNESICMIRDYLFAGQAQGSIAAELCWLISLLVLGTPSLIREQTNYLALFYNGLYKFFFKLVDDFGSVNPHPYNSAVKVDDNYELSSTRTAEPMTVKSESLLLTLLGNLASSFCLTDIAKGKWFTLYPPKDLITDFIAHMSFGVNNLKENAWFKFEPTIQWLESKQIVTGKDRNSTLGNEKLSRGNLSQLIQSLIAYDNQFDSSDGVPEPCVLKTKDFSVYAIKNTDGETFSILSVLDSNGENCSLDGVLVFDKEDNSVIVNYSDLTGNEVNEVLKEDDYVEQYLGKQVEDSTEEMSPESLLTLGDMEIVCTEELQMKSKLYSGYVAKLCELQGFDYFDELENVRKRIVVDLFHVMGFAEFESAAYGRILKSYAVDNLPELLNQQINFESLCSLFRLTYGNLDMLTSKNVFVEEDIGSIKNAIEGYRYSVVDYCRYLDTLDFDVLALQVLSKNHIHFEGKLGLYMAMLEVPGVSERLRILENKCIVANVFSIVGTSASPIFRRSAPVYRYYSSAVVTAENVDELYSALMKGNCGNVNGELMYLYRKAVKQGVPESAMLMKYFLMDRNISSVLSLLSENVDYYGTLKSSIEDFFGYSVDNLLELTDEESSIVLSADRVYDYFWKNTSVILDYVYDGLIAELTSTASSTLIKSIDLFNDLYSRLLTSAKTDDITSYGDCFFDYFGSQVITYCIIIEEAAYEASGGALRDLLFVQHRDDFVYDVSLAPLSRHNLMDYKNLTAHDY